MNCLEFRHAAGADPRHLSADAIGHRDGCPQCAGHLRQLLAMDVTILKALQVQGPTERSSARPVPPRAGEVARAVLGNRNRWYALAASIVGGVLVGVVLWASGPRNALARDVLGHIAHEPQALVTTQVPVGADRVRDILAKDGLRLRSDMGLVSYAMSCPFRGHEVPHLVVQTAGGPVTVLVLRDEKVTRVMRFHEQGYVGTLEPAGPGSIAVIGSSPAQVKEAAERVAAALEWTTP
jgi:hypothetical protein